MARRLFGLLILGGACLDNNPKFVEPGPTDPSSVSVTTGMPGETTEGPTPSTDDPTPTTATTEQPTTDATTGPMATTTPAPVCPNGQVEADEECDDGNLEDLDGCSNDCQLAACGDGVVQEMEVCDDGNQEDADECNNFCTGKCGDEVVQANEECDDANSEDLDMCSNTCVMAECGDKIPQLYEGCDDGNDVDFDGCDNNCLVSRKLVFVTSKLFTGAMGGLAGADADCKKLANDAGVPGDFVAWLSAGPMKAKDRVKPALVPYALRKGDLVALDFADLIDNQLLQAIDQTETGGKPPPSTTMMGCNSSAVYTNTAGTGDVAQPQLDCAGWTITRTAAVFGDWMVASKSWTDNCMDYCSSSAPIYCIQQ